jgi:hypothetical protein
MKRTIPVFFFIGLFFLGIAVARAQDIQDRKKVTERQKVLQRNAKEGSTSRIRLPGTRQSLLEEQFPYAGRSRKPNLPWEPNAPGG